jgi:hypothetical protein
MGTRVLPVVFMVTLVSCASASYVALTTGGYENIVIKVEDDAIKSGTSCQTVMETIRVTHSLSLFCKFYFENICIFDI